MKDDDHYYADRCRVPAPRLWVWRARVRRALARIAMRASVGVAELLCLADRDPQGARVLLLLLLLLLVAIVWR